MDKQSVFNRIDRRRGEMTARAFAIFDQPEWGGDERAAARLLVDALRASGFTAEEGVGGLETAFRATWSRGTGGPNIGLIGEYDAVRGIGHACGHHLQMPAVIAAAEALKEAADVPCTITVYGTPAEETFGGKIAMLERGCFRELDVVLAAHAAGDTAYVGGRSLALAPFRIDYSGMSAHASGAPWEGRSALDAMLLTFQGIEFLREHLKDGSRVHYSVREGTGPSNAVPARASAAVTLRSPDNAYLAEMEQRFRNVVAGACLMTDTAASIHALPLFQARRPNAALGEIARRNMRSLPIERVASTDMSSGGSTDFGNISCAVPGVLVYLPFNSAPAHSQAWYDAGKTDAAVRCMMWSAKTLAGIACDLLDDPGLLDRVKAEHRSGDV